MKERLPPPQEWLPPPKPAPIAIIDEALRTPQRPRARYPFMIKSAGVEFIAPVLTCVAGSFVLLMAIIGLDSAQALLAAIILPTGGVWFWACLRSRCIVSRQGVERRTLFGTRSLARDQIAAYRFSEARIGGGDAWILTPTDGGRRLRIPAPPMKVRTWLHRLAAVKRPRSPSL